jgi:hypothetical protein
MKRIVAIAFLVGCGGASSTPAKSRPAPTEADACERMCSIYEDCRIAPPNCATMCATEKKRFRDGVHPALASCLERELAGCEHREMTERRQIVSLCFAAVLEVYSKDAPVMDTVIHAACARAAKCSPDADPECEKHMREQHKESADSKLLSLIRPELLAKMASCVEAAPCDDLDAIQRCSNE